MSDLPESLQKTIHHASADAIDHVPEITDPGVREHDKHIWGDRLMITIGNISAWLFPILMVAIVSQVFLRKAGVNQAWLDDAQWWMYGFAVLTGMGYAVTTNSHVRVDIFHANFGEKKKARIEIFGLGWLFLPFLILMTDITIHYAYASWLAGEGSDSPNGLHKLYLLKISIPILFLAAIIASIAALLRNLAVLNNPTLWRFLVGIFPAAWFAAERFSHYVLWWYVRFTKPDLHPRAVGKDSVLDNTILYGFAIIVALFIASLLLGRDKTNNA